MGTKNAADAATAAFFALLDVIVEFVPGAWGRDGDRSTRLVVCGSDLGTFNGVFSSDRRPDVSAVAALGKELVGAGMPWSVLSRTEPEPELRELATGLGLTGTYRSPLMLRSAGPLTPAPAGPSSAVVRVIEGSSDQEYVTALAAGFEAPRSLFENLMPAAFLDAPGMSVYLVEDEGEVVATGLGLLAGGLIGVYNISTPPAARRRGYGRLVTEAILRDGFAAGADGAYLLSSELGLPLYRTLGFTVAETWTYLMSE